MSDFDTRLKESLSIYHMEMRFADDSHWLGQSESGGHDEARKATTKAVAQIKAAVLESLPEEKDIELLQPRYAYAAAGWNNCLQEIKAELEPKEGEQ